MAVLHFLFVLFNLAQACIDDEDCSLLGKCKAGVCACNKGWTGYSCARADLEPLDVKLGYHNVSEASWGGRPVQDPKTGKWQLFATEIKNHCPLILFQYNSMVIRAESISGDPGGPYRHTEVVLPPFHHNPTIVGPTPDGYYLLFFIGTDRPQGEIDCRESIPNVPAHPDPPLKSNGYTTMAYTKDLENGPWHQKVVLRSNKDPLTRNQSLLWHCSQNNPSAQILPNGTVVLVFRANACPPYDRPPLCTRAECRGEKLGVAIASHFLSEFEVHPKPIVAPYVQNITSNNEDPFLFTTEDGSWHIINHQQSKGNVCGSTNAGHSCGAHFFARHPHGPWAMSPEPVYGPNVTLTNGSAASFQTRQRPQLVFDGDGDPQYLFTSGSFVGNNPDLHMTTHTFAHKFRK